MILIKEVEGEVLFRKQLLTGNVSSAKILLTGNIINGGAKKPPTYGGDYTITPSSQEQVLATAGRMLTDDITVNPIPSNYGLVTWNGSYLTVS